MIQSPYLDLAIGLAVMFLLCSLVVSGLNEGVNWLTRTRSKFLWAYLHDLFDGTRSKALPRGFAGIAHLWVGNDHRPSTDAPPPATDGGTAAPSVWLARIARALDPIDAPQLVQRDRTRRTSIKSVPASSLAEAIVEVFADLAHDDVAAAVATILDPADDPVATSLAGALLARVTPAPASAFAAFRASQQATAGGPPPRLAASARAVDELLVQVIGATETSIPTGLRGAWSVAAATWPARPSDEQLRLAAAALSAAVPRAAVGLALGRIDPSSPIFATLRRLYAAADGQPDRFRSGLEAYFDGELKRLSGYYRRSIRIVVFVLALVVAVAGGIDTVSVTQALWRNPDGRAALVREADALTPPSGSTAETTKRAVDSIQVTCENAHPPDDASITTPAEAAAAYAKVRTCVSDALDELTGLGVIEHAVWVNEGRWLNDWSTSPVRHAAGVLLTALSLLLGAPFWFDVIKRLTGMRKGLVGDT